MGRRLGLTILALAMASTRLALAADCAPANHLSTCVDADTFWPRASPSSFQLLAGVETIAPGRWGFGLAMTYLRRPLVLVAPSADPSGAAVASVDHLWNATFLWSFGLTYRLAAELGVPVTLYRAGLGTSPFTAERSRELSRAAFRDVRVGAVYRLVPGAPRGAADSVGLAARLELAIPTGESSSFAGGGSFVGVPSLSAELRRGRMFAGAELGARIRPTADLAGTRVGPQIVAALGMGAQILPGDALRFSLEAFALPTLTRQEELAVSTSTGERLPSGARSTLVPAEWHAALHAAVPFQNDLLVSVGGGGPIAFGGESAATAPSYRFTLSVRYAPVVP